MFSSEENSKKADSKKAVSFKADGEKAAIEKVVGENIKTWDQLDIASMSSEENGEIADSEKADSKKADSKKAVNEKEESKKAAIEKVVSNIEKIVNEKAASENMGAIKKAKNPLAAFVFPEPPKEPPTALQIQLELLPALTEFQKLAGSLVEPLREPRTRALSGTEKIPLNEFPNLNVNPNPNTNPNPNPNLNPNPNVPRRNLSGIDNLPKQSLPNRKMPLLKKLHKKNKYSNVLTFPF